MATCFEDTDKYKDLMTCTICLETFTEPKSLPCLHTFCKVCINTYILSSVEKESECKHGKGFSCPVCRQLVSYNDSKSKPDSWATELPCNHFVMSLLDEQQIKKSDKLCNSCQIRNEKAKAVSWCVDCEEAFCEQCEIYHKTFKMSMNHKIIAVKDIQTSKSRFQLSGIIKCDEHPDKIIEVFCVDHTKPCCTLCATLSHRKCENVTGIDEAATGVKQSLKASDLSGKLKETCERTEEAIQNRKQNLNEIENQNDNISKTIEKTKDELIDYLKKIEQKLQCDLASTKKQVTLKITDEIDKLSNYKSIIVNWEAVFNSAIEHGSDHQCLVEIHKILPKICVIGEELNAVMRETKEVSITLNLNKSLETMKDNVDSFGNISLQESVQSGWFNLESGNIHILHTIETGGSSHYLSGIFMDKFILLTIDSTHEVVKYCSEGKRLSTLKVDGFPKDIAQMNRTNVAVSKEGSVHIINSMNMTLMQTIKLQGIPVYGICYVENKEAFIFANSVKLTWVYASSGVKLAEKKTRGSSNFVSITGNEGYIHADGSNAVVCIDGSVKKFTYNSSDLSNPKGLGIDCKGNIYIACDSNIHQISKDGNLIRIIQAATFGIEEPRTIRFSPNSNRCIVTSHSGKATICVIE